MFSTLYAYLGENLLNEGIQKYLYCNLGMRRYQFSQRLNKWKAGWKSGTGKSGLSIEDRQKIHDLWLKYATLPVDRRDARDIMKIPLKEYTLRYPNINCEHTSIVKNKRNTMIVQAPRYVSTITVHQMLSSAKGQCNIVTSFGTVISLRPFFLVTPSEREKLECLCTTCLNTRLLFDVVMGKVKDVQQKFKSITKYFTNRKECMMTRSGNFSIDCINNLCNFSS